MIIKFTPFLVVFSLASSIATSSANTFDYASINGTDIVKYEDPAPSGGELFNNPAADLNSILEGNAAAPGGNIELFFSSDFGGFIDPSSTGAFASVTPTILDAYFSLSGHVSIRSLNGADWFYDSSSIYNIDYGADNLANTWFDDFLVAVQTQAPTSAPFIAGNEQTLFERFRDNGGFAQSSDPNISYVELDTAAGSVKIGLGGFLDVGPRVAVLLGVDASLFTNALQISEVAIVNSTPVYGFSATPSNVYVNDGVNSYNGNYEVSAPIPEPSTVFFMGLASLSLVFRRRR